MRASHDSRETFERMSHDVCANFDLFHSSQLSLETALCRIFVSLCRSRKLPCDVFAKGWRRVRDICDDLAMVLP